MIVKAHIEKDLKRLNRLYTESLTGASSDVPIYYSKLAVLELAGWLEESFDLIAFRAMKGKVSPGKFQNLVDDAVKKNHGFNYDNNFLVMMAKLIGLTHCEKLDRHLDSDASLSILRSELNALQQQRRTAAHVNIARTTLAFDAPSVSLARMQKVYPILRGIYRWFC
ncbi:hypothetical protein Mal15_19420 [Stieleria maiorica]|uniref:RiboL-PSP-HEPN domain-containing protein n=1 Tax=Stieleria maiorica TaxID=2795974 RepID=A0A5B9MCF1_9BACT|nr:hypothetical protein [Stieleria maiorica]QEF97896.1 hypothetical protein Mal15_19420 [Stieleria maiorica]